MPTPTTILKGDEEALQFLFNNQFQNTKGDVQLRGVSKGVSNRIVTEVLRRRQAQAKQRFKTAESLFDEQMKNVDLGIPSDPAVEDTLVRILGEMGQSFVDTLRQRQNSPGFLVKAKNRQLADTIEQKQRMERVSKRLLPTEARMNLQEATASQRVPQNPSAGEPQPQFKPLPQLVEDLGARVLGGRMRRGARQQVESATQQIPQLQGERRELEGALLETPSGVAPVGGAADLNAFVAFQNRRTPEQQAELELSKQQRMAIFNADIKRESDRLRQTLGQKFALTNINKREVVSLQSKLAEDGRRSSVTEPFAGSIPFRVGDATVHIEPEQGSIFEGVSNIGKLIQDRDALTAQFGANDPRVVQLNKGLKSALAQTEPDFGDVREAIAQAEFGNSFNQLDQTQKQQVLAKVKSDAEAFQAAGRSEAPLPSELIVRMGASNTALRIGNDIFKLFAPVFTGPLVGRVGSLKQILGLTKAQENQFRQSLEAFNEFIIRSRTGAQASFGEMQTMRNQNPSVNEKPGVVLDKLKATMRQLMFKLTKLLKYIWPTFRCSSSRRSLNNTNSSTFTTFITHNLL